MKRGLGDSDSEGLTEDILPEGVSETSSERAANNGRRRLSAAAQGAVSIPKEAFDDPGLNFGWAFPLVLL